ncbi:HNH endonuclease [Serratia fonticola]|uniref:HNH endonuclease n=1 Tax=Serratia fonticola TaxID=47917 RepID=A0A559T5V5_SERFO|nr:HNH endonuclease signature motif containing protein [Serratia fonticola]TQI82492.1 HNH endonuclease [Serratia fonticola]TQI95489.1 HNH endonuclease [Serratia fonticola]TVZ69984.1 HNH endonuclease [Serratia fonticola]
MIKPRTTLKQLEEISPDLWKNQPYGRQIRIYITNLINQGIGPQEIIARTRSWVASGHAIEANRLRRINNRKPHGPPPQLSSARLNAGGLISLSGTRKIPPYRRGKNIQFPKSHVETKSHTEVESPISSLQTWLLSIEDDERKEFVVWCTLQGKTPSKVLWDSFKTYGHTSSAFTSKSEKGIEQHAFELTRSGTGHANKTQSIYSPTLQMREYENDGWSKVKIRKAQGRFRQDVLANWGYRCAITGSALVIEACHIISHASGGTPSVENGIALAVDFHRLLDSGHLRFHGNQIALSDDARKEPRYCNYDGGFLRESIVPVNLTPK